MSPCDRGYCEPRTARGPAMKSDNPLKHFAIAFLIAILIYFVSYHSIEHRRNRKGPWQVTFTNSAAGESKIVINQPFLRLTNVEIVFGGESPPTNKVFSTLE